MGPFEITPVNNLIASAYVVFLKCLTFSFGTSGFLLIYRTTFPQLVSSLGTQALYLKVAFTDDSLSCKKINPRAKFQPLMIVSLKVEASIYRIDIF